MAIVGNGDGGGWEDTVKFAHERADEYYGITVEASSDSSSLIWYCPIQVARLSVEGEPAPMNLFISDASFLVRA